MKITLEDCIAMCGLTEEEVLALAEHEHQPEIVATALASYLLRQEHGAEKVRDMIVEDIRQAQLSSDRKHVLTLLHVLHHFLKTHPEATPSQHPWSGMRELAKNKQAETPQDMGEFAVRSMDQARAAFSRLMDAARQTQEMMKTLLPSNPMVEQLIEAQKRAMTLAQQNLDATFALADELAKARDLAEVLQILSRHALLQMHAVALQAQELAGMVTEAAQKSKR